MLFNFSSFGKKPIQIAQTAAEVIQPSVIDTQKLLQEQIKSMQEFTVKEIPQMKGQQEQLIASLEKLSQSAKALIK